MGRYDGLDRILKQEVLERDGGRCRWCGRVGVPVDPHHIRYRRGSSDDVPGNLISLCRRCHDFVHGAPNAKGVIIPKQVAQVLLWDLIELPGVTGMALWRQRKSEFARSGLCEHGQYPDACYHCMKTEEYVK
jgi:hypothetical protein